MSRITDQITQTFEILGLTPVAALVYRSLLSDGPASALQLARRVKASRMAVYLAIKDLTNRGLVSTTQKGKRTQFTAENPEELLDIIEQERSQTLAKHDKLRQILPELTTLYHSSHFLPKAQIVQGLDGMMRVWHDILETLPTGGKATIIGQVSLPSYLPADTSSRLTKEVVWHQVPIETKSKETLLLYANKLAFLSQEFAFVVESKELFSTLTKKLKSL